MLQAGRSPVRIPDEVDFVNLPNPSSRTMGSTQPPTEMSTRNLPGGNSSCGNKESVCRSHLTDHYNMLSHWELFTGEFFCKYKIPLIPHKPYTPHLVLVDSYSAPKLSNIPKWKGFLELPSDSRMLSKRKEPKSTLKTGRALGVQSRRDNFELDKMD
jgi:hypothetical protein